jgi:hypothetical protein
VRCTGAIATWGTTPSERAAPYPCDALIERPDLVLFRAVDVAAPTAIVYRWLCQLRVAPYSYDWIDNLGRRSPRRLIDGLDRLEPGQRMMTIFRLVSFEDGRSITVDSTTALFGRVAATYDVVPVAPDRCRLVVKLLCVPPRTVLRPLMRAILPPGDLVMMRRQLRNLRDLAERDARTASVPTRS